MIVHTVENYEKGKWLDWLNGWAMTWFTVSVQLSNKSWRLFDPVQQFLSCPNGNWNWLSNIGVSPLFRNGNRDAPRIRLPTIQHNPRSRGLRVQLQALFGRLWRSCRQTERKKFNNEGRKVHETIFRPVRALQCDPVRRKCFAIMSFGPRVNQILAGLNPGMCSRTKKKTTKKLGGNRRSLALVCFHVLFFSGERFFLEWRHLELINRELIFLGRKSYWRFFSIGYRPLNNQPAFWESVRRWSHSEVMLFNSSI